MRMRKKKNLSNRIKACSEYLLTTPEQYKEMFTVGVYKSIFLEIGCGKGGFAVKLAQSNPDALVIAIDKVSEALVVGMESAAELGISNVRFVNYDALKLEELFEKNELGRIYLNFSDPWPKARHEKRRLTSPKFLNIYRKLLKPQGLICFKTDNRCLFDYSVSTMTAFGLTLQNVTYDLHAGDISNNIETEYEKKFVSMGMPIHRFEAVSR